MQVWAIDRDNRIDITAPTRLPDTTLEINCIRENKMSRKLIWGGHQV